MQLYPLAQLTLLFWAFLGGIFLGVLSFAGRAFYMLLGVLPPPAYMKDVYQKRLPLLSCTPPFRERVGRARRFCLWCGDFFFCLAFAVVAVYILYRYNSGALRLSVPLLLFLGFFLWRRALSWVYRRLVAYLAYALAVLWLYVKALLLLPLRLLYRLLLRLLWRPLSALGGRLAVRFWRRRLKILCRRQLALAENGLFPGRMKGRKK